MNVIVLLADGARADWFASALDSGAVPALARLRDEGALHGVTTVFPSVTVAAYSPFLTGRFPGGLGMPGIRWYDRERTACTWPDYARSYVGYQMTKVDSDIDPDSPTVFELVPGSVGALSAITRGLSGDRKLLTLNVASAVRATYAHFFGDANALIGVDREVAQEVVARGGDTPFMFASFLSVDKVSHVKGHTAPETLDALRIMDGAVRDLREKLERRGTWASTRLWITSDHGHTPVDKHEDLEGVVAGLGFRVIAHPLVYGWRPEAAVMVSGNAMAHVYVDLDQLQRPFIGGMSDKARELADQLLERPSVDLLIAPLSENSSEVHSLVGGHAIISRNNGRYSYERQTGDPLSLGVDVKDVSASEAHAICFETQYPDAIVQIAELAGAPRSGDIILSSAAGWDFRARYEPSLHVSGHGSLRRSDMLVPLLSNIAPKRTPRRTVDILPSALAALGRPLPTHLDGESFE